MQHHPSGAQDLSERAAEHRLLCRKCPICPPASMHAPPSLSAPLAQIMEILLSVQEQRLADLMRVLQNRYSNSDSQSYSGEFSTGWTSGALSRLDDTANLKNKVSWSGTSLMPLPLGLQKSWQSARWRSPS